MMAGLLETLFGTQRAPAPGPRQAAAPAAPTEGQLALGRQIYQFFVQQGLQPHQAAAIAGNMVWEGGGRTDLVNPNDNARHSPNSPHSIGIAQWNDRAPALIAYARANGIEIPEGDLRDAAYAQNVIRLIPLQTQLQFAWSELQGPEGRAFTGITGGNDLRSAARAAIGYHRPAGWTADNPEAGHAFNNRLTFADAILRAGPHPEGYVPPPSAPAPDVAANTPPPSTQTNNGGLLSTLFGGGGTQNTVLGALFGQQPPAQQQQQPPDLADLARRRADAVVNPAQEEPSGIRPVQLPQLDLTRLRALMQKRGMLGTPMES